MLRIEEVAEERGLDAQDVIEFLHDFVEFTENSDLPALKEALTRSDHAAVRESTFNQRRCGQPETRPDRCPRPGDGTDA